VKKPVVENEETQVEKLSEEQKSENFEKKLENEAEIVEKLEDGNR